MKKIIILLSLIIAQNTYAETEIENPNLRNLALTKEQNIKLADALARCFINTTGAALYDRTLDSTSEYKQNIDFDKTKQLSIRSNHKAYSLYHIANHEKPSLEYLEKIFEKSVKKEKLFPEYNKCYQLDYLTTNIAEKTDKLEGDYAKQQFSDDFYRCYLNINKMEMSKNKHAFLDSGIFENLKNRINKIYKNSFIKTIPSTPTKEAKNKASSFKTNNPDLVSKEVLYCEIATRKMQKSIAKQNVKPLNNNLAMKYYDKIYNCGLSSYYSSMLNLGVFEDSVPTTQSSLDYYRYENAVMHILSVLPKEQGDKMKAHFDEVAIKFSDKATARSEELNNKELWAKEYIQEYYDMTNSCQKVLSNFENKYM